MNLKEKIENNPIYFIFTLVIIAFTSGWAVNETLESKIEDRLNLKGTINKDKNEDDLSLNKITSKANLQNCKPVKKESLPIVIDEPYFTNGVPNKIRKGEKVEISIPYAVGMGYAVAIWAHEGDDTLVTKNIHVGSFQPSKQLTGSGVVTRWFQTDTESRIRSIDIVALHLPGDCSVVIASLPVDIQVK